MNYHARRLQEVYGSEDPEKILAAVTEPWGKVEFIGHTPVA